MQNENDVSRLPISQAACNTYMHYPDVLLFTVGANKSNARGWYCTCATSPRHDRGPEVPLTKQQMRIIHAHTRIELTDISASTRQENMLMMSTHLCGNVAYKLTSDGFSPC